MYIYFYDNISKPIRASNPPNLPTGSLLHKYLQKLNLFGVPLLFAGPFYIILRFALLTKLTNTVRKTATHVGISLSLLVTEKNPLPTHYIFSTSYCMYHSYCPYLRVPVLKGIFSFSQTFEKLSR
jgi:hypothetical protein